MSTRISIAADPTRHPKLFFVPHRSMYTTMHVTTDGSRASMVDMVQTKPFSIPNNQNKLYPTANFNDLSQYFETPI